MSRNIQHVVRSSHYVNVAVLVNRSNIKQIKESRKTIKIALDETIVILPECRNASMREWQTNNEISNRFVIFAYLEKMDVESWNSLRQ
jgi:hypothetical protein